MEYLPIVLEGIENKLKKLIYNHSQQKAKTEKLKEEKQQLQNELVILKSRIKELEEENKKIIFARTLKGFDKDSAQRKVNEMLREIDKCYSLLNR